MENMNPLTITNTNYINAQLNKETKAIRLLDSSIQSNQFAIAYHMALVADKEWFKDDDFDDAPAWAMHAFGIKKSLAYSLIKIGREYTREYRNTKGRIIGYGSNIVNPIPNGTDCPDMPPVDFTTNQIGRLATLGRDVVKSAYEAGEIKPTSTAKEIAEYIKLHKAIKAGETDTEPEQPTEPEQVTIDDVQNSTSEPEPAKPTPARMWTVEPRNAMYDNISTSMLVAELRARGFIVYDNAGKEVAIDWKTVEGE